MLRADKKKKEEGGHGDHEGALHLKFCVRRCRVLEVLMYFGGHPTGIQGGGRNEAACDA